MIIMKFGGSSLATAERIKEIVKIVKMHLDKKPILVFSACGKTTDLLLEAGNKAFNGTIDAKEIIDFHYNLAKELNIDNKDFDFLLVELQDLLKGIFLFKEFSNRIKDRLMSYGERLSVRIISAFLSLNGISSKPFDAWDVGFLTDSNHGNAQIDSKTYGFIYEHLNKLKKSYEYTPIITGFIAKDENGIITTLGRSGSDLTASVLGASLLVDEIQVWKDVDGILSADPRIVKNPKVLPELSFDEASELAYFGAKVLHPASIVPAMQKQIPVRVKNSYNINAVGTVIVDKTINNDKNILLKAITSKRKIILIDIISSRMLGQFGFLAKVFDVFEEEKISVDMIASSEVSISLTLDNRYDISKLQEKLLKYASVNVSYNKSIISLIANVNKASEILGRAFSTLSKKSYNIQMISHGASKVNISFIVDDMEVEDCIKLLHKEFFE